MDTAPLKSFATWARTALIREVTARIAVVLAPASPQRVEQPKAVAALEAAIAAAGGGEKGRDAVTDRVAYTWFNRIIALRFMDANGYTGIGVVSPQAGVEVGQPEILAESKRANIDPEVVSQNIRELVSALLNGTRRSEDPQGEAYALLLVEYCRHWNRAMPFMFEREGDFTELLMPTNLLADESVLNRAVTVLTESVCQDVEVIGWLYQFYISERKDEVFAGFKENKKAGAEEIPAATQLFTPHWIVRYLVENSLGRLWMLNRPGSRLIDKMEFYFPQPDAEVDFLNLNSPEEIKIIDPACGSGHMLTYAFDLLYSIYEEEGYAPSEIPSLILSNNLYGTEIDPRASALAGFALTMKARARQRSFLRGPAEPNVCLIEAVSFTTDELAVLVTPDGDRFVESAFWNQFENASTLGSLLRPPLEHIEPLRRALDAREAHSVDLLSADVFERARRVIEQAEHLVQRYHVVVANPPYMGARNMSVNLSAWLKAEYPDVKSDIFGAFIYRCLDLAVDQGQLGFMSPFVWMFISSFTKLRHRLLVEETITSLIQLEYSGFDGATVPVCAFTLQRNHVEFPAGYVRLSDFVGPSQQEPRAREIIASARLVERGQPDSTGMARHFYRRLSASFALLPDQPLTYWLPEELVRILAEQVPLADRLSIMAGISTGDNGKYFRLWPEVSFSRIKGNDLERPWAPHHKGGPERRWYGNVSHVLRYDSQSLDQMQELAGFRHDGNASYFKAHIGWSALTSGAPSFRYIDEGHTFGSGSKALIGKRSEMLRALGVLNSTLAAEILEGMSPTMNFEVGHIGRLPMVPEGTVTSLDLLVEDAVELARQSWDESEASLDFRTSPILHLDNTVEGAVAKYRVAVSERLQRTFDLEESIDCEVRRIFALDPSARGRKRSMRDVEQSVPNDVDIAADLVSFFVGCLFGRYSLDEPGLVLADQGATLNDYLDRVPTPTFVPDADNVIPVVDGDWFDDDIVTRFRQFLRVAFGEKHFEDNLCFVTEALGVKDLRDYFVKSFYKDHVQRYKKRPIYWLFSSPKGSFNALIYMHRYTPSTVSTVLNEYLREFKAKLAATLGQQERLAAGGGAPRQQAAAQKEADRIRKVLLELDEYEHDVLYPLASQQIEIDLDDGVKVNYPKFGAALKKIPGLEAGE